jgi:ADP-ribose pyrophosphatase
MKSSKIKIGKTKRVYNGKEFSVDKIDWELDKKKWKKEVLVYPDTVAVLGFLDKNNVLLVRQYRFPVKKELWELPAGRLEKGEKPIKGAKREFKEETGYSAGLFKKIADVYLSPGHSTECIHIFKATKLKKGKQFFDDNEFIANVRKFDIKEVKDMIKKGKIVDAKTIIAVELEVASC